MKLKVSKIVSIVAQSPEFGRRGDKIDYEKVRRRLESNTFLVTKES